MLAPAMVDHGLERWLMDQTIYESWAIEVNLLRYLPMLACFRYFSWTMPAGSSVLARPVAGLPDPI